MENNRQARSTSPEQAKARDNTVPWSPDRVHKSRAHPGPSPTGSVTPAELIALAFVLGSITGLAEVSGVLTRQLLWDYPAWGYSKDAIWMGPLAGGVAFGLGGLLLAPLASVLPPERRLRITSGLLTALSMFAFFRAVLTGIHSAAALVFAVGFAFQASRFIERRATGFRRLARRAAAITAVCTLSLTAATLGLIGLTERVRVSRLADVEGSAPNVLFIILDTVRASNLSLYGYERPTTPHLDRFADEGTVFNLAISPSPWSLPSHATMFSGYFYEDAEWHTPLSWQQLTLAEDLRDRGFLTAGFVANLYYGVEFFGLDRGFTHYESYPRSLFTLAQSERLSKGVTDLVHRRVLRTRGELGRKSAERVRTDFLDWLDQTDGRRFFGFLNFIDAHDPYLPPPTHQLRFTDRTDPYTLRGPGASYSAEEYAQLEGMYDNAISYVDEQLGRLFDEMRERGVFDNTLVIVTSDHGEEFGEHGFVAHSATLYLPSLHVPLVVRFPGLVPSGTRIDAMVSLRDLPATVLDLTGGVAQRFPGQSLSRFWLDSPSTAELILAETTIREEENASAYPAAAGPMWSMFDDPLHFIRTSDSATELYNVRDDPWERSNLFSGSVDSADAPVWESRLWTLVTNMDEPGAR